jgi:hypothetical protein
MVEFILGNMGFAVFIVLAIVFRVVQARLRTAARREEAPPVFASDLEADDDDDAEGLIDYARTRGASDYAVEMARQQTARQAEENRPRFEAIPALPADKPPPLLEASPAPVDREITPPQRPEPGRGFSLKTKKLNPLQQAVLWAEILGKPKGMA